MSFSLTKEGTLRVSAEETEAPEPELVTSFEEWKSIAGAWPVKRLVALWNDLPGVIRVVKFNSREIALERIWRTVHSEPSRVPKKETPGPFRDGSKAARVYALLCRSEGATTKQIQELTGWQRHSVRGFLSASLRKQGHKVRSFARAGERVYRLKG